MTAYVLYHNERFLVQPSDPNWPHYRQLGWWLLVHGVAGGSALLLAPLQFSDRLRRRFVALHRNVGRIYVFGVFVLAPFGAYLQYRDQLTGEPWTFTAAAIVDAVLLAVTTGIAFVYARQRKIRQHRHWMTRSYAVALVFFEVRAVLGLTGWERLGIDVAETTVWCCLAFALVIGDIANDWYDAAPARTAAHAGIPREVAGQLV
jgi:uncharacterized membrane protein